MLSFQDWGLFKQLCRLQLNNISPASLLPVIEWYEYHLLFIWFNPLFPQVLGVSSSAWMLTIFHWTTLWTIGLTWENLASVVATSTTLDSVPSTLIMRISLKTNNRLPVSLIFLAFFWKAALSVPHRYFDIHLFYLFCAGSFSTADLCKKPFSPFYHPQADRHPAEQNTKRGSQYKISQTTGTKCHASRNLSLTKNWPGYWGEIRWRSWKPW